MNSKKMYPGGLSPLAAALLAAVLGSPGAVSAASSIVVQCPGDIDGDAIPDRCLNGTTGSGGCKGGASGVNPDYDPNVQCYHLTAGDGFVTMADGRPLFTFGFHNVTGVGDTNGNGDIADDVTAAGLLAQEWPAPPLVFDEGKKVYLNLTNVGMVLRPDLFDPHTVHFHGYPNSSTVFDGLPESGIAINQGATLTYFYNAHDPGTYMYHCHVEATEHMQMGMLGSLYMRAGQSKIPNGTVLGTYVHSNSGDADAPPYGDWPGPGDVDLNGNGVFDEGTHDSYVYNDGDGSTRYDVEYAMQLGGFDPEFHDASYAIQPLPFALMWDRYPMINGRGYPDTTNPDPLPPPVENGGLESQKVSSLVTATQGQRILLRLSNLNITVTHTLTSPSIPMTVVGVDARELRSTTGQPLHYKTNSVSLGGGMATDVILDTTGVPPGEYYLYAANLQYLANNDEAAPTGGMMTKIVINP